MATASEPLGSGTVIGGKMRFSVQIKTGDVCSPGAVGFCSASLLFGLASSSCVVETGS